MTKAVAGSGCEAVGPTAVAVSPHRRPLARMALLGLPVAGLNGSTVSEESCVMTTLWPIRLAGGGVRMSFATSSTSSKCVCWPNGLLNAKL